MVRARIGGHPLLGDQLRDKRRGAGARPGQNRHGPPVPVCTKRNCAAFGGFLEFAPPVPGGGSVCRLALPNAAAETGVARRIGAIRGPGTSQRKPCVARRRSCRCRAEGGERNRHAPLPDPIARRARPANRAAERNRWTGTTVADRHPIASRPNALQAGRKLMGIDYLKFNPIFRQDGKYPATAGQSGQIA